jgi:hypothetical protein
MVIHIHTGIRSSVQVKKATLRFLFSICGRVVFYYVGLFFTHVLRT